MLAILNANAGVITAVATVALCLITLVYVAFTARLSSVASRQAFETTLFRLLESQRALARTVQIGTLGNEPVGWRALETAAGEIVGKLSEQARLHPERMEDEDFLRELVDNIHMDQCRRAGSDLDNYFRQLFWMLDFVATGAFNRRTLRRYATLIRGQLTQSEQTLILYHSISRLGAGVFLEHVQRLSLLAGMEPSNELVASHMGLAGQRAYFPTRPNKCWRLLTRGNRHQKGP